MFSPLSLGQTTFDWSRTYLLGVINVTPDSFSDAGAFFAPDAAVQQGILLAEQGADLLDVGGESTRPGAPAVNADEEVRRVVSVIEELSRRVKIPLSIDTMKGSVADAALRAGAVMVNDVSGGLGDTDMLKVVARHGAAFLLGHLRGTPRTMQQDIQFADVVREVTDELGDHVVVAERAGVARDRIVVDPGLGFGKTAAQTYALLHATGEIRDRLRLPICLGVSRKSFLAAATGAPVADRVLETAAAVAAGVALGADMVRVHDVAAMKRVVRVADSVRRGLASPSPSPSPSPRTGVPR
jgi:dihydropteroate synthase